MIAFACCIASEEKFRQFALPGLNLCAEPDSPVLETSHDSSIHEAYNEVLDYCCGVTGLEALVLLHEDTEIRDKAFCTKVRNSLSNPEVGVLGVIGARHIASLRWWEGEGVGRVSESRGLIDFGSAGSEVDAVDGLLMVLSPWAVNNLRFDSASFVGFHAYDLDLCFSVRAAGRKVQTFDVDVFHHTKGGYGDASAFERNDAVFRDKWNLAAVKAV